MQWLQTQVKHQQWETNLSSKTEKQTNMWKTCYYEAGCMYLNTLSSQILQQAFFHISINMPGLCWLLEHLLSCAMDNRAQRTRLETRIVGVECRFHWKRMCLSRSKTVQLATLGIHRFKTDPTVQMWASKQSPCGTGCATVHGYHNI